MPWSASRRKRALFPDRASTIAVALCLAIVQARAWAHDAYGMEFTFLGCVGDWPERLPIEPVVTKESGSKPSFFVRDPVDCGLAVKDATYELDGDTLVLSYSVHADGPVAACYCEYDSRFTFEHLPVVDKVSFSHRP